MLKKIYPEISGCKRETYGDFYVPNNLWFSTSRNVSSIEFFYQDVHITQNTMLKKKEEKYSVKHIAAYTYLVSSFTKKHQSVVTAQET